MVRPQKKQVTNVVMDILHSKGIARTNILRHHRDTTTETLRSVFSQYGELEDAIVTMDRITGKSKGYGFVTFRYSSSANAAVSEPEKQIDVSSSPTPALPADWNVSH